MPTTIDAGRQGRIFTIDGDNITVAVENLVLINGAADDGGAIYVGTDTAVTLRRNVIEQNEATGNTGDGGAINVHYYSDGITLLRNVIRDNTAGRHGGAILADRDVTMINNLIADNTCSTATLYGEGAGLWLGSGDHQLAHTTFANNAGGDGSAVRVVDTAVLTNTIVYSHAIGINAATSGSVVTLDGTLWYDTTQDAAGSGTVTTGTIDVHADPAFVDVGAGDYHLTAGSPAIDAGVSLSAVTEDLDCSR